MNYAAEPGRYLEWGGFQHIPFNTTTRERIDKDHNAILGIELHFEFTTFELLKLFDMCDAEPGIIWASVWTP